jgi:hypothetical protein
VDWQPLAAGGLDDGDGDGPGPPGDVGPAGEVDPPAGGAEVCPADADGWCGPDPEAGVDAELCAADSDGLFCPDGRAAAAPDCWDSGTPAACGAVPQADTANAVAMRAATTRSKPGGLVRSVNPRQLVLGDIPQSHPGRNP